MVEVGALPINPSPPSSINLGEANVVADTLSRSQRKLEEGSTDGMATETARIERHVSSTEWSEQWK